MQAQPIFTQTHQFGHVKQPGSFVFDAENNSYLIKSAVKSYPNSTNHYYYLYCKQSNNFIINTLIQWANLSNELKQKAGIMIRESIDNSSKFIAIANHGNKLISLQYRINNNDEIEEIKFDNAENNVLHLNITRKDINIYIAQMGQPLKKIKWLSINFSDTLLVGLFVCTEKEDANIICNFRNTMIYQLAKPDFIPYHDYIGSQLEIINIETKVRKIIYATSEPIEAPNWSRNGKYLIYNSRGLLYKLTIGNNKPKQIFTDFANANNNDHGISFDGKYLAISHHVPDKPQGENSLIYILPIDGGTPKLITENGPSYWHGWSPDNKWLVYTARRNNRWNIYKISIEGGQEIQLTNNEFLNDGPEFSPDGNYIWFNSNRTGKMQIWLMKSDGSDQLQMTHDEFQNWFPHPSPDGSKIVFLSYLPDEVNEWEHPYYKQVMLRIMDLNDLHIYTIAYLYGGQGTINVPSWSPNSKHIAFVSNNQQAH